MTWDALPLQRKKLKYFAVNLDEMYKRNELLFPSLENPGIVPNFTEKGLLNQGNTFSLKY